MWKRGSNGDLVVKIEVEQPDEAWAIKLKEEGGVEGLAKLLQEKRPDVENPKETDEVELEKFDESVSLDWARRRLRRQLLILIPARVD